MSQELFNNILATIGAFTGLSGFLISLYLLHKEKLKIEVFHPTGGKDSAYLGFNGVYNGRNDIGEQTSKYTPYMLFIWLQITNKSKSPTTILEMSLKLPSSGESILYSQTSDNYSIATTYTIDEYGEIKIKSNRHYPHVLKPPISLNTYSTVEGYFYFRDLQIAEQKPFTAILKLKTTQGIKKHSVTIKPNYPTKL